MGIIGIEDKLQDEVAETIKSLKKANIRVLYGNDSFGC
jgi:magnesium-transporting ATPase (P-type)